MALYSAGSISPTADTDAKVAHIYRQAAKLNFIIVYRYNFQASDIFWKLISTDDVQGVFLFLINILSSIYLGPKIALHGLAPISVR